MEQTLMLCDGGMAAPYQAQLKMLGIMRSSIFRDVKQKVITSDFYKGPLRLNRRMFTKVSRVIHTVVYVADLFLLGETWGTLS